MAPNFPAKYIAAIVGSMSIITWKSSMLFAYDSRRLMSYGVRWCARSPAVRASVGARG